MQVKQTVSLVFPAYNEAEYITRAVADAQATGAFDEIIVVDNNSRDRTAELAAAAGAKVIRCEAQGYGHALQAGMRAATGDLIALCEPDGTFDLKDIRKLLAYVDDFDVVAGTRTNADLIWEGANMRWDNRMGNLAVAKLLEWLFNGPDLSDVGCTFRVLKRTAYEAIRDHLTVGGSHLLPEIILLSLLRGQSVIEVPVNYRERTGESKITGTYRGLFRVAFAMISVILSHRFRVWFDGHLQRPVARVPVPRAHVWAAAALALVTTACIAWMVNTHLHDPPRGDDFDFVSAATALRDGAGLQYFRAYISDGTQIATGQEGARIQTWSFHPPGAIYVLSWMQRVVGDPVVAGRVMNLVAALLTILLIAFAYRQFYPDHDSWGPPLLAVALWLATGPVAVGALIIDADTALLPLLWLLFWALYYAATNRDRRWAWVAMFVSLAAVVFVKATHVLLVPFLVACDQMLRANWRRSVTLPLLLVLFGFVPAIVLWAAVLPQGASVSDALTYYRGQTTASLGLGTALRLNGTLFAYAGPVLALAPPICAGLVLWRLRSTGRGHRAEIVVVLAALVAWRVYLNKPTGFRYHMSSLPLLAPIVAHHAWSVLAHRRRGLVTGLGVAVAWALGVALLFGDQALRHYWATGTTPWLLTGAIAIVGGYAAMRRRALGMGEAFGSSLLLGHVVASLCILFALSTQPHSWWQSSENSGYGQRDRPHVVAMIQKRLAPDEYFYGDPGYAFDLGHQRVIWPWLLRQRLGQHRGRVMLSGPAGPLPIGVAIVQSDQPRLAALFVTAGYEHEILKTGEILMWRNRLASGASLDAAGQVSAP